MESDGPKALSYSEQAHVTCRFPRISPSDVKRCKEERPGVPDLPEGWAVGLGPALDPAPGCSPLCKATFDAKRSVLRHLNKTRSDSKRFEGELRQLALWAP